MKRFAGILLLLVVALFALGLHQLFNLRFESGDFYPNYSSLRADPLGTKALYESYERLLPTRRNYRPLSHLKDGKGTALFFLGLEPSDLVAAGDELAHLESFVKSGGRLVLGLEASQAKGSAGRKPAAGGLGQQLPQTLLTERWDFELAFASKPDAERATLASPGHDLPQTIPFRSSVQFTNSGPEWNVVYNGGTNTAVLMERTLGLGTIVVFADSYLFSNEAMLKERHPPLLAWVAGSAATIVFDETHLGVRENPGIANLARKYRLHGVGLGVLLLAALFIWKNAVPFLPPHPSEVERASVLLGKDSAAGFVNLLRRNVPASELFPTCVREWQKSCAHKTPQAKLLQMQQVIDAEYAKEPKQRHPLRACEALRQILARPGREQPEANPSQSHERIQT